jgi:hypothetical protein
MSDEDDDQGGEQLSPGAAPPFVSLEDTRRLAVEAAHRTIAGLAGLPCLSEAGARQLRVLVGVINDAEELEIRKFVLMGRIGDRPGQSQPPDVEKAQRIAAGEDKAQ